jgi:hypothetical protein
MWQREAMWLSFRAHQRPHAVKVAAGKVNAVSGEPWEEGLRSQVSGFSSGPGPRTPDPGPRQDYLVAPPQPWLDGFHTSEGKIRQFVAMPLGMGYTVEGHVTGKEDVGGLQLLVYPPKPGRLTQPDRGPLRGGMSVGGAAGFAGASYKLSAKGMIGATYSAGPEFVEASTMRGVASNAVHRGAEMGLAQGGEMVQKIYPDEHGLDTWDVGHGGRLFVHIVNSELYREITGEAPPPSPITAQTYAAKGYPWFQLWDAEMKDIAPSEKLAGLKTVAQMDQKHGFSGQQDDSPVFEKTVPAGVVKPTGVSEGKEWG